jgi:Redoxin
MIRRPLPVYGPVLTVGLALLAAGTFAQTLPASPALSLAPAKGDVVPAFESLSIDGTPRKVDFPQGSQTVLLIFSAGCPHCQRMIPEWNRAFGRKPKDLRVFGVLTDRETPGFWQTFSVVFPVVRSPGRQFLNELKVHRVPLMLRVAGGGRIEDVISGETDPIRLGELFHP